MNILDDRKISGTIERDRQIEEAIVFGLIRID
jgi:hypothetical protein